MARESARASDAFLRFADLLALTVAGPLALLAGSLLAGAARTPAEETWWPLVAVSLPLWMASAWLMQVYEARAGSPWHELWRVTRTVGLVAMLAAAGAFFTRQDEGYRLMLAAYYLLAWAELAAIRVGIRGVLRASGRSGWQSRYYAVVGTGELANSLVEVLRERGWGLKLAGFVVEDRATDVPPDCVILGRLSEFSRILEEHVLDEVFFAIPRERLHEVEDAIRVCEELGVSARFSLDVMRFGRARLFIDEIAGQSIITLSRTPRDTLALAVKRAFDLAVSAAVLLILSPLLAGVALAIKLESPGPVFFRQRRVGLNGRTFQILKFRSMHLDAESRLEALRVRNEMSGPVFKMKDDPRVTRVGRFIRRTSLDEFPQFLNVLMGDMSVVGPRPPLPSEVRQYKRWQRRRLSVKPGITCIWQISGRNEVDFERWMELDLEYIDGWSLWGDVQICLRTIPAVLGARGAR